MDVPALQPAGYVLPNIVGSAACAPFNPFGSIASSEEARNFAKATTISDAFIRQTTAGFSLAGDSEKFLTMPGGGAIGFALGRSEEHTSELQSLMRISYAVLCLKKKK